MERFTQRAENGNVFYPHCFERCQGIAETEQCINCEYYDRLLKKFADYEDAEEQGLLLRLPCAIGTTLYYPRYSWIDHKIQLIVNDVTVESADHALSFKGYIGKTVFLTQAEAEQALKRLESET